MNKRIRGFSRGGQQDKESANKPLQSRTATGTNSTVINSYNQAENQETGDSNNNQSMAMVLQQIQTQLTSLQNRIQAQSQSNSQQSNGQQYPQGQSTDNSPETLSQELQKVFSKLLQSQNNQQNQTNTNSASGANNQSQSSNSAQDKNKQKTVTVQTAAQALADAQYELSTELENSLQKLKQVIRESEQLADRISNLLGEDNTSQQQ